MTQHNQSPLDRLLTIMARLRDPLNGCEWDRVQTFASIAPYTIEEAYEVADAIARNDINALKDELGDLLLQVVYHARMAEEAEHFQFHEVAAGISDKLEARHPHIFGTNQSSTECFPATTAVSPSSSFVNTRYPGSSSRDFGPRSTTAARILWFPAALASRRHQTACPCHRRAGRAIDPSAS